MPHNLDAQITFTIFATHFFQFVLVIMSNFIIRGKIQAVKDIVEECYGLNLQFGIDLIVEFTGFHDILEPKLDRLTKILAEYFVAPRRQRYPMFINWKINNNWYELHYFKHHNYNRPHFEFHCQRIMESCLVCEIRPRTPHNHIFKTYITQTDYKDLAAAIVHMDNFPPCQYCGSLVTEYLGWKYNKYGYPTHPKQPATCTKCSMYTDEFHYFFMPERLRDAKCKICGQRKGVKLWNEAGNECYHPQCLGNEGYQKIDGENVLWNFRNRYQAYPWSCLNLMRSFIDLKNLRI